MPRDGYVMLGAQLTPEEAGMAQGLLASAGIEALLEDQALSAVDPLVRLAIGGTKLLVRQEDAERARALIAGSGLTAPASARPADVAEIPEEEWSALPPAPPPEAPAEPSWSRLVAVLIILVAAAMAVLGEASRRPLWPFWRR